METLIWMLRLRWRHSHLGDRRGTPHIVSPAADSQHPLPPRTWHSTSHWNPRTSPPRRRRGSPHILSPPSRCIPGSCQGRSTLSCSRIPSRLIPRLLVAEDVCECRGHCHMVWAGWDSSRFSGTHGNNWWYEEHCMRVLFYIWDLIFVVSLSLSRDVGLNLIVQFHSDCETVRFLERPWPGRRWSSWWQYIRRSIAVLSWCMGQPAQRTRTFRIRASF